MTEQPYGSTIEKEDLEGQGVETRLVDRFNERAVALVSEVSAEQVLDVGCGSGWVTSLIADANPQCKCVGLDRENPKLRASWAERACSNLAFATADAYHLPFPDGHFDAVTMFEVLEHLDYPGAALSECLRVSSRWLIVSVPWEPMWRVGNVVRRRYLWQLGNTPGHVNHWSRRGFRRLMRWHGPLVRAVSSVPWNLVRIEKLSS